MAEIFKLSDDNILNIFNSDQKTQTTINRELTAQKAAAEQVAMLQKQLFDIQEIQANSIKYGLEKMKSVRDGFIAFQDSFFKKGVERIDKWAAGG